jgi:hypothetical protein
METNNESKLQFPKLQHGQKLSVRAQWARVHAAQAVTQSSKQLVNDYIDLQKKYQNSVPRGIFLLDPSSLPAARPTCPETPDVLVPAPSLKHGLGEKGPKEDGDSTKVAIIGAGVSGLFTAMILQWLNENAVGDDTKSFNVDYDILESSASVGGRLFTYSFEPDNKHTHVYYDVGAMRFPDIDTMKR